MQTTLLASIGGSSRTSARGKERPVKGGVPKGCSAISRAVITPGSSSSPSMLTNATPSGLAIRPRRICLSLLTVGPDLRSRARCRYSPTAHIAVRAWIDAEGADRHGRTQCGPTLVDRRRVAGGDGARIRLHQWRRVHDPRPGRGSGHAAGRGRLAVVDAELW